MPKKDNITPTSIVVAALLIALSQKPSSGRDVDVKSATLRKSGLSEAIEKIPSAYSLGSKEIKTLALVESNANVNARRDEPNVIYLANRIKRSHIPKKDLAAAHGAYQVLGLHAHERGLPLSDLYDPNSSTELAASLWAKCKEYRCKSKRGTSRSCLRKAAVCYNAGLGGKDRGSAARYADKYLQRFDDEDFE